MSKVLLEMSMSLDGYVTGPDVTPEEPKTPCPQRFSIRRCPRGLKRPPSEEER